MKILLIHNKYLLAGGEDQVVKAEKKMLEKFGHEVVLYQRTNSEVNKRRLFHKLRFYFKDIYWSAETFHDIKKIISKERPDIAHFHNTFFVVTPSAYDACYEEGIPIVQTLHNYRFLCPIGLFYRNDENCEECLKSGNKMAVIHRCWRNSFSASFILTKIISEFRRRSIIAKKINHFIALSKFSRQKYVDNGFDEGKVSVKPNFIDYDPGVVDNTGQYGLFIGGLFAYKGIKTLLEGWAKLKIDFPLKVIGDGPLLESINAEGQNKNVEFLGRKSLDETIGYIKNSRFVVVPSECYENFPRVVVESFACGRPVIASNHGVFKELVSDGSTGLLFEVRDSSDLAEKVATLVGDAGRAQAMGRNARKEYERKYTMQSNYQSLMRVYENVLHEQQD